uniref:Uncharacterized protein n=1 Tax=Otolemur garnettii TaxID=30611 RepID=H0XZR9_OTOGA
SGGSHDLVQREIHQDWVTREYIEIITRSIKKMADFLNSFDMSSCSRFATVNEKLIALEWNTLQHGDKGETLT